MSLLIISYNEGEQDFYKDDIKEFTAKVNVMNPDIICLCTQKSKSSVAIAIPGKKLFTGSNSTKHFPHVFKDSVKDKYEQVISQDGSFIVRAVTENNNIRTRIFCRKDSLYKLKKDKVKITMSQKVFGQSTMKLNRQAIMCEFNINSKKYCIINTELDPNTSINGKYEREKEFIGLIDEFSLYDKYTTDSNIIFCGSFNFRASFFSHIDKNLSSNAFNSLSKILEKAQLSTLLSKNELKIFINHALNNYTENLGMRENMNMQNNSLQSILGDIQNKKFLLEKFKNSLETIGFKFTCDYNLNEKNNYKVHSVMKLGSLFKKTGESFNKAHKVYKESKGTLSGLFKGAFTGAKGVTTNFIASPFQKMFHKTVSTKSHIQNVTSNRVKQFKLPAMCDKILFALRNDSDYRNDFEVIQNLKKSRHRIVYASFNIVSITQGHNIPGAVAIPINNNEAHKNMTPSVPNMINLQPNIEQIINKKIKKYHVNTKSKYNKMSTEKLNALIKRRLREIQKRLNKLNFYEKNPSENTNEETLKKEIMKKQNTIEQAEIILAKRKVSQ